MSAFAIWSRNFLPRAQVFAGTVCAVPIRTCRFVIVSGSAPKSTHMDTRSLYKVRQRCAHEGTLRMGGEDVGECG